MPVKTGRLRDSLVVKKDRTRPGVVVVHVGATYAAPHAHLVEFGTVNSPARPFLRPAYDANRMAVLSRLRKEVGKRIEREVKKLRAA